MACNCYKIISRDMNLPKPWEEQGKEDPESSYEQWKIINQKKSLVAPTDGRRQLPAVGGPVPDERVHTVQDMSGLRPVRGA